MQRPVKRVLMQWLQEERNRAAIQSRLQGSEDAARRFLHKMVAAGLISPRRQDFLWKLISTAPPDGPRAA